jgi:formylglycine-generating enzyme required for sulfatase activity
MAVADDRQAVPAVVRGQFEYAARAGTLTAYPWGDEIGKNNANCAGCGSKWDNRQPASVGPAADAVVTNRAGPPA